jgi:hypothetical protein
MSRPGLHGGDHDGHHHSNRHPGDHGPAASAPLNSFGGVSMDSAGDL